MQKERQVFRPEREKEKRVFRPCSRTKKVVDHEGDSDTNYNWHTRNSPQGGW